MTEFTKDFTHNRINFWTKLLSGFVGKNYLRFLEIGTFEGRSAIWLLENILTGRDSKLTIIDPFIITWENKFKDKNPLWDNQNIINETKERFYKNINPYFTKVDVIELTSFCALTGMMSFKQDYFDFIYIDGSHKASDCLEDMVLSLKLLKKNGILLMDDYKWGKKLPAHFTPGPAIDAFMSIYKEEIKILYINNQVAVQKL